MRQYCESETHGVASQSPVVPAQAGIQYAVSSRLNTGVSGILDRPIKSDDEAFYFDDDSSLDVDRRLSLNPCRSYTPETSSRSPTSARPPKPAFRRQR